MAKGMETGQRRSGISVFEEAREPSRHGGGPIAQMSDRKFGEQIRFAAKALRPSEREKPASDQFVVNRHDALAGVCLHALLVTGLAEPGGHSEARDVFDHPNVGNLKLANLIEAQAAEQCDQRHPKSGAAGALVAGDGVAVRVIAAPGVDWSVEDTAKLFGREGIALVALPHRIGQLEPLQRIAIEIALVHRPVYYAAKPVDVGVEVRSADEAAFAFCFSSSDRLFDFHVGEALMRASRHFSEERHEIATSLASDIDERRFLTEYLDHPLSGRRMGDLGAFAPLVLWVSDKAIVDIANGARD